MYRDKNHCLIPMPAHDGVVFTSLSFPSPSSLSSSVLYVHSHYLFTSTQTHTQSFTGCLSNIIRCGCVKHTHLAKIMCSLCALRCRSVRFVGIQDCGFGFGTGYKSVETNRSNRVNFLLNWRVHQPGQLTHCFLLDFHLVAGIVVRHVVLPRRRYRRRLVATSSREYHQQYQR